MANIQRTRGVVLRAVSFKESSLICSTFTEKFGKIKLLAKGARRPTSKFCGTLEPFIYSEFIFYKKEYKEIYTLSDAVVVNDFKDNRNIIKKFNACEILCEFFDKVLPNEEVDKKVFGLLVSFLNRIKEEDESQTGQTTIEYLLKALKIIGFQPYLKDCNLCHQRINNKNEKIGFSLRAGGIVCDRHYDNTVIFLTGETIMAMQEIYENKRVGMGVEVQNELEKFIMEYIYYHTPGIVINSLKFIK